MSNDVIYQTLDLTCPFLKVKENTNYYLKLTSMKTNINLQIASFVKTNLVLFSNNTKLNVNLKIDCMDSSEINIYNVMLTSKDSVVTETVNLLAPYATVEITNVILTKNISSFTSHVIINHLTNNTSSNLNNYAIAKDNTKIILDNIATLKKGAFKSNAKQASHGLTIGNGAMIKALPNLYIDEYDVLANHAAAIGTLNSEDLFYLMSRGLTENDASEVIIMGFIKPLLDKIPNKDIKKRINSSFVKNLNN